MYGDTVPIRPDRSVSAWCVIDANEGCISRYQMGGRYPVRTHAAQAETPLTFTEEFVEEFRLRPPADFYVGGGPWPPSSPDGGVPVAAQRPREAA